MNLFNWWTYTKIFGPDKSIFPDNKGGPKWIKEEIPKKWAKFNSVQGWKLHICVFPDDIENLFNAISEDLSKVAHKFYPFDEYKKIKYGSTFKNSKNAIGKACTIYPNDPKHLKSLVDAIDLTLSKKIVANKKKPVKDQLRPYPGGVRGDIALGKTGFIYCRYGAFWGDLANKEKLYNNIQKKLVNDPRSVTPYPDFIKSIPNEIRLCKRR
jgi:hypothetical protein